jgi:hypothetical protein
MNGVGGAATLIVTAVVITTKFADGAWMVIVAIPVIVLILIAIRRHYRAVGRRLRAGSAAVLACREPTNEVVVYVERLDAATEEALWYAREISGSEFHAVHVPTVGSDSGIRPRFFAEVQGSPHLEVIPGADGPLDALLEYIWRFPRGEGSFVTVVIPELFRKPSLASALRRQTFPLKLRLVQEPGVVVTDIPRFENSHEPVAPKRSVGLVPVSGVHAASLRAIRYAETLPLDELRAVFFAFSAEEAERFRREWERWELEMAVEIHEAPYRDLGDPLLRRVRAVTADPDAVAVVLMPELVVHGWARLLHNQRALYVKRLLLFEPRTILSSVPYHLP